MARMDCYKPENQTPARALREALDAINAVHRAFGAPGDYGYGMPQGDALHYLYATPDLICPVLKGLGTSEGDGDPAPRYPRHEAANARLIAVGPEMEAACRNCLSMLEQTVGDEQLGDRLGMIGGYRARKMLRDVLGKLDGLREERTNDQTS